MSASVSSLRVRVMRRSSFGSNAVPPRGLPFMLHRRGRLSTGAGQRPATAVNRRRRAARLPRGHDAVFARLGTADEHARFGIPPDHLPAAEAAPLGADMDTVPEPGQLPDDVG